MDIHFTKYELCVEYNTELTGGKCLNEACAVFYEKLYDHRIQICYFIKRKAQLVKQCVLQILHQYSNAWTKLIKVKS